MKISITTPTGQIGRQLADRLLSEGVDVTILARNPGKVGELSSRGARVIAGDQLDAHAVNSAIEGADAFFWLTPIDLSTTNVRDDYNRFSTVAADVIRRHPDVRIVNLSSVGAELDRGTGPVLGLHDAEAKLNQATENVTHLRANYFMENVLTSVPTIIDQGSIYSTIPGNVSLAQVATRDIAAAAAHHLVNGERGRHVVDVFGPDDITFNEVASTLADVLGTPVTHVQVPKDQLRAGMLGAGISADAAEQLLELQEGIAAGRLKGVAKTGWKGKMTFAEFARQVVLRAIRSRSDMAKAG
jgi:uncharacterized protein YbjT (DUF2867 family)